MNEFGPESHCKICGGPHPTGQCPEAPRVVLEHGKGKEMEFKEPESMEVFKLALEQEIKNRGLDISLAEEKEGFVIFTLSEGGKNIGQIEIVHEPTAGQRGWEKAFTINFAGFDGEGLTKLTIGNPQELSGALELGINSVKEYYSKYGSED